MPSSKPDIQRAFKAQERALHDLRRHAPTSTILADLARTQAQIPKFFETSATLDTQKLRQRAITTMPTSTVLADLARTQAQIPKFFETSAILDTQKLARCALGSASASRLVEKQLRELARSPFRAHLARDFAALRHQIAIATGSLPPLVATADVDVAVEVGIREARTLRERWRELPDHRQTQLEVCLLVLIAEVGNVVTDFAPSEHATRILHLLAAVAALHAVLTSWDDGGDGPRR